MIRALVISFVALLAWAQSATEAPRIGFMQDAGGSVRPVLGVTANFVLGDSIAEGVISAAFSGMFGMVKTDSTLLVMDRQGVVLSVMDAPPGPALFAFSQEGKPALVYFLGTSSLMRWQDGTSLNVDGVLSIAALDSSGAAMIVQRDGGLWHVRISLDTGAVESQTLIPDATAPVLLLANGDLLFADATGIVIRKPDGTAKHIDARLPAVFSFQQLGAGWVQLLDSSGQRQLAVRTVENLEQVYQLPGMEQ